MEERENKREETASDAELQRLVEDFITQKQVLLIQVKNHLNNIFSVIPDCHRSWMTKAFRISGW